jgi:hypothetical protein
VLQAVHAEEAAVQPDLPLTVAEWRRNSRETLRVTLDRYNGQVVIDCRAWWCDAAGDLRPGRAGLTFAVKHLPTLHEALAEALTKARSAGHLA